MKKFQYRTWDYFLLHTPKHVIQFNFVDVISGDGAKSGICPTSLIIFDKTNPAGTMRKIEENTFTCPIYNRSTLFDFD